MLSLSLASTWPPPIYTGGRASLRLCLCPLCRSPRVRTHLCARPAAPCARPFARVCIFGRGRVLLPRFPSLLLLHFVRIPSVHSPSSILLPLVLLSSLLTCTASLLTRRAGTRDARGRWCLCYCPCWWGVARSAYRGFIVTVIGAHGTLRGVLCPTLRAPTLHCAHAPTLHMPPHCTVHAIVTCAHHTIVTCAHAVRTRYARTRTRAHAHVCASCARRACTGHMARSSWCVCTPTVFPTVFAVTCICRAELTLARVVCVRVCACVLRAPCRAPRAFPHRPRTCLAHRHRHRTCLAHRHRHRGSWYVAWRVMFHAPCPRTVRCTPCVRTPHHRHVCARVTHACVHHVRALCSGGCSQPAHSGLLMGLLMGRRAGIGVAPGRWCLL